MGDLGWSGLASVALSAVSLLAALVGLFFGARAARAAEEHRRRIEDLSSLEARLSYLTEHPEEVTEEDSRSIRRVHPRA
jgi:hypothetical protein